MLSYALAIAVAFSSLVLFFTAFVMSDIHRKDDFLWSGVGLFYALVLWFCARNITGAVLLGQGAVSILVLSFVWQTLKLRKAIANPERAAAINNFSVLQAVNGFIKGKKSQSQTKETAPVNSSADVVTESKISIPETTSTSDSKSTQQKKSKFGSLNNLFGKKKKSAITNTKLDDVLEQEKKEVTITENVKPISKDEVSSETKAVENVEESLDKGDEQVENNQPQVTDNKIENAEVPDNQEIATPIVTPEQKEKPTEIDKIENQELDTPEVEKSIEIKSEVSKAEEEIEKSTELTDNPIQDNLIQDNPETKTEVAQEEKNPEIDDTSVKVAEETQTETQPIESKKDPSPLDSLEAVEVAEVLDAVPDNNPNEINSDSSNIIEVTTTDIEETKDLQQQDKDVNLEEK